MTIIPPQPVYATNQQVPLTQVKNNKKIKNITNKKQNKKNEEIIIEDDPEEINNNNINERRNNNNSINDFNMMKANNNMIIDNVPQIINSFYYINNNTNNTQSPSFLLKEKEKNTNSNETSINYNEELSNNNINNINSINNNSLMMKKLKKPKTKKYNCIFNKNTLQILENMSITNEDKLLYILNNFKNIRIDPLIIKVLEERKTKKRIGLYESILSEEQNTSSNNEREKARNDMNYNTSQNNANNALNPNGVYVPPPQPKPTFPMDDKILFSDLEKYNISTEILDRPLPKKIDHDFHMLNKLFIVGIF